MIDRRDFDDLPGHVKDAVYDLVRGPVEEHMLPHLIELYESRMFDYRVGPTGELQTRVGPLAEFLEGAGLIDLWNLTGGGTVELRAEEE